MARRKQNAIAKNDFAAKDDIDICGFSTEPIITGECIFLFSFDNYSINKNEPNMTTTNKNINNVNIKYLE